jgi:hypothetical protein
VRGNNLRALNNDKAARALKNLPEESSWCSEVQLPRSPPAPPPAPATDRPRIAPTPPPRAHRPPPSGAGPQVEAAHRDVIVAAPRGNRLGALAAGALDAVGAHLPHIAATAVRRPPARPPARPPPSRTKWTCRVPRPVLIGHVSSLTHPPPARPPVARRLRGWARAGRQTARDARPSCRGRAGRAHRASRQGAVVAARLAVAALSGLEPFPHGQPAAEAEDFNPMAAARGAAPLSIPPRRDPDSRNVSPSPGNSVAPPHRASSIPREFSRSGETPGPVGARAAAHRPPLLAKPRPLHTVSMSTHARARAHPPPPPLPY